MEAMAITKKNLYKRAGIFGDVLGADLTSVLNGVVPHLGDAVNTAGSGMGYFSGSNDLKGLAKEVKEINETPYYSLIPGIGAYRIAKKKLQNALANNKETATANMAGEYFGGLTSSILPAILGGIGGAAIGRSRDSGDKDTNTALGGMIGAATAVAVPHLVAGALALIRKRRSKQEQKEHDQSTNMANWFIPGVSTYNNWKRIGRIRGEEIGEN